MRRAIYIPFPQAVPLKAVVDKESCLLLSKGKCKKTCVEACKAAAIDFDQKEEMIEKEVGSIIIATGYDPFDPHLLPQYGYGVYDNIITGLQFERLSSPSGPTRGEILLEGWNRSQSDCFSPLHRKPGRKREPPLLQNLLHGIDEAGPSGKGEDRG